MARPRYLFVVSRGHPELYDVLLERFQGDQNVEVILDRRSDELVAGERRQRPSPANDLNLRSHLIITRTD